MPINIRIQMKKIILVFSILLIGLSDLKSQCCLLYNDTINSGEIINTFYPAPSNTVLAAGSTSIILEAVPSIDQFGNSYGNTPIYPGDVVLIIQMQGALFNSTNSSSYGSGITNSGPDNLGGTGYSNLGSVGLYEFVIAQNFVPLSGGILQLNGVCSSAGIQNTYVNSDATNTNGQASYQVVRIPRFQNLTLQQSISTTAWNGSVGGILGMLVQNELNMNGYSILASGKGFRGGFQNVRPSGANTTTYVSSDIMLSSGKGEGICGTPRFLWNGQNQVDNGAAWIGYPNGNYGRGAPGNAGGGGNTHNAGGGGGGGAGAGGVAGNGFGSGIGDPPNGGRPGLGLNFNLGKLLFGGGGGGGDANNAQTGVKGGAGGGIIFIKAGIITGTGIIDASGTNGQVGVYGDAPDGAGGGGGGGMIVIQSDTSNQTTSLILKSTGGNGGNTLNDLNAPHGPGGGGGGGRIFHQIPNGNLTLQFFGGTSGATNNGNGGTHGALNGQNGNADTLNNNELYQYLPPSVSPKPEANFDVTDICTNEPYVFINTSTAGSSASNFISTHLWSFGDGNSSSNTSPTHTYTSAGSYLVTLHVQTNLGCTDSITQMVNVYEPVTIVNSTNECDQYTWSVNNQNYTESGQYTEIFSTIHGCDSIQVINLTIHPTYVIPIQDTICQGDQIQIGSSYFTNTGNYTVQLNSIDGCDSTIQLNLVVNPLPAPPILYSTNVICPNEPIILSADSISNATINWLGPNGFNSIYFINEFYLTTDLIGMYTAYITQLNCNSPTSELDVNIDFAYSFKDWEVPNVISPNGDQINDVWDIPELSKSCESFQLIILNRWGQEKIVLDADHPIFEGKDANGFDFHEGVYFYKLIGPQIIKHGFFHVVK